jgi:hypothetical protein
MLSQTELACEVAFLATVISYVAKMIITSALDLSKEKCLKNILQF